MVSFRDTLTFEIFESHRLIRLDGYVQCQKDVRLEVTKEFRTRYDNRGRMSVRCYRYRYVGIASGKHLLLKYHNLHDNTDDYIHRVYDPTSCTELFNENLQRHQFPTFSEVLDELEYLARDL